MNLAYAEVSESRFEACAAISPFSSRGPVLRCKDITAEYYGKQALCDISCEVSKHAILAIMGPSGCGKSTFLKTLNRSLELTPGAKVTGGEVWFAGRDIYAEKTVDPMLRRKVGAVLQRPVVFPMSIKENVIFGARFHRLVERSGLDSLCEASLRVVGLWDEIKDRLEDSAGRLSIGQQQRLCIARTLANKPEIILMDEPCSALDPRNSEKIEELVQVLKAEYAIVIVTHNIGQARRLADQAMFFYSGRLEEYGEAWTVFNRPQGKLLADFVGGRFG
jgi:phosphate transport system ATP-binding protein